MQQRDSAAVSSRSPITERNMGGRLLSASIATVLLATISAGATAQPSTFRISQVFSNLDGSVQFVELTESAGLDGQHRLAGLSLTITREGVVKRFTFPRDLPMDRTANLSIVIATAWVPLSNGFAIEPEITGMPPRFLPTDGGTLEFAGIDRMTYDALPVDGARALHREAGPGPASVPSNGRCPALTWPCAARFEVAQRAVFALEYHHAALDHYFLSASAPDIDALDSGRLSGWRRTGERFHVGGGKDAASGLERPVCRLYLPPGEGDSHFLSASGDECEAVRARFPQFVLENRAAFHVALPDERTGQCGTGFWPGGEFSFHLLLPVYRLWNARLDSNHRYTKDAGVREQMIAQGYVSEGYGPLGVAMCVLPTSPWDY